MDGYCEEGGRRGGWEEAPVEGFKDSNDGTLCSMIESRNGRFDNK
jgi:hypothetical protein